MLNVWKVAKIIELHFPFEKVLDKHKGFLISQQIIIKKWEF